MFLVAVGYLIASSVAKRSVEVFAPTAASRARPAQIAPLHDTVTVDAGDGKAWRFFDFERGSVISPPDTSDWDLAFRRFHIRASDAVADAGLVPFARVTSVTSNAFQSGWDARDSSNTAMRRWYDYSMLTHLLEPNGHVYVVRTRAGRHVKLEILSYYCHGLTPGCVTFRYGRI